jgi:hypothetical protein
MDRNFAGSNTLPLKIWAKKILMGAPIGCPTLGGRAHLTIAETESRVGAPTKPAPGAQFRGLAILQAAEKKWSGREDLNLRPPGPELKERDKKE